MEVCERHSIPFVILIFLLAGLIMSCGLQSPAAESPSSEQPRSPEKPVIRPAKF